jgi:hypothetical protein
VRATITDEEEARDRTVFPSEEEREKAISVRTCTPAARNDHYYFHGSRWINTGSLRKLRITCFITDLATANHPKIDKIENAISYQPLGINL